jgi:argininosuccinate synthase
MGPIELLTKLNKVASANGVGTIDIIENRLVGMKSRGVYETPGGTVIFEAHKALERLILDRETMHYKKIIAEKFAELCYNGLWFSPLMNALMAFVDATQEEVSGTVKMKLYKGSCSAAASKSDYSLYSEEFATFSKDDVYNQSDATGFINLWSLPLKIRAIEKQNREGVKLDETLERKVYKSSEFVE